MPRVLSKSVLDIINQASLTIVEILEISIHPPYTTFDLFFVNNLEPIVIGSQLYAPVWFQRGTAETSSSQSVDRSSIEVDNSDRFWSRFVANVPITGMRARVKKVFYGNVTSTDDCPTVFDGFLGAPSFTERSLAVEIRAPYASRTTELPNRLYSPNCGVAFGSPLCGIDITTPRNRRQFIADSGSTIYRVVHPTAFYDLPGNHFSAGYVYVLTGPMRGATRPIMASNHTTVTLLVPFPMDPTGFQIRVQTGCMKNKIECDRHANRERYRGFSEVPLTPSVDTASTVVSSSGGGGGK